MCGKQATDTDHLGRSYKRKLKNNFEQTAGERTRKRTKCLKNDDHQIKSKETVKGLLENN